MRWEPADPTYLWVLGKLRAMHSSRSLRLVLLAEMWEPVALKHHPTGEYTGFPCAACGQPWPCETLLGLAHNLE
jgi:hypothetical protein